MDKVIEKMDEILQTVKVEYDVADVSFDTWLKPLKVYEVKDNVVTIPCSFRADGYDQYHQ